jgi:hypothetical protein
VSGEKREFAENERYDRHHVVPVSRGGGSGSNIVVLPARWHAVWHAMFVNMTVAEVHAFIDEVMVPDTEWTQKSLSQLRLRVMRES